MGVLLFLEKLFSSASMEYLNQLIRKASEDEIFMESQLLNYKSSIKFLAIFSYFMAGLYPTDPPDYSV